MRILSLVPEAFGGRGGIAQYNRDLLEAMCLYKDCSEIVSLPRRITDPMDGLPKKLHWISRASRNIIIFFLHFIKIIACGRRFDLVVCSHINLLPFAWVASVLKSARLVLVIYGIDAWSPTRSAIANRLVQEVDAIITISNLTLHRFCHWSKYRKRTIFLIPNAIRLDNYGMGVPKRELIQRHQLSGCRILLSLGRMSKSERYKGIDEVIELLPELLLEIPNLKYVIAGYGDDLDRLTKKVVNLNISDSVIFTGYISEADKCDYYRLADAFVLPGRGEGFGFVFLEAMACGVPVVASVLDGSREAVREGLLGIVVNPDDKSELKFSILQALKRSHEIPLDLEYFSFANFIKRVHDFMDAISYLKKEQLDTLKNR